MTPKLILASQSPRRRELLSLVGIPFAVVSPEVDETPAAGELPEDFARRMAREKGVDVASRVTDSLVLSADTVVAVDNAILGKPVDEADARRMLQLLSGRQHSVYTAVRLENQASRRVLEDIDRTEVWFAPLTDSEIRECIQRDNAMDKAGAYAIQGFAGLLIPRIEGNYFNVMGLPLPLVYRLVAAAAR